jgi:hypothetical protein
MKRGLCAALYPSLMPAGDFLARNGYNSAVALSFQYLSSSQLSIPTSSRDGSFSAGFHSTSSSTPLALSLAPEPRASAPFPLNRRRCYPIA